MSDTHTDIENKLTELLAEEWRDSVVASAIREGVRKKREHLTYQMARGKVRNTAGNRGYLEALKDLEDTLTQHIGEETTDATPVPTQE